MSVWEQDIEGVAAVMQEPDISTDIILPGAFMVTLSRQGLGRGLFYNWRQDESGKKRQTFVLNQSPFDEAVFLIAGENFGCGSSREHAVWALLDFGIRAVIAPSFSQTFATNSAKNGLAALQVDAAMIEQIVQATRKGTGSPMRLSLAAQVLKVGAKSWRFDLTEQQVVGLIDGVDDMELAEIFVAQTDAFWRERKRTNSWIDSPSPADEK